MRSTAHVVGLLAVDESIPGFMDERLVQKAINDTRMHPVSFGQSGLEMAGNMLNMALACGMKCRAEATCPVLALAEELDDLLGMRASRAAVALLVMLVEGV